MAAIKPEETLHTYLRRHFEQIAKRLTRQIADQPEPCCIATIPELPSARKQLS